MLCVGWGIKRKERGSYRDNKKKMCGVTKGIKKGLYRGNLTGKRGAEKALKVN